MMADDDMDATLQALASASRRQMLDLVKAQPGVTVGALANRFEFSRVAVIKHLRVLEDANLVLSRREGRSRRLYFNAVPIQMIHERWTDEYSAYWSSRLIQLKFAAEGRAEDDRSRENDK